jgi:hypothetical protein
VAIRLNLERASLPNLCRQAIQHLGPVSSEKNQLRPGYILLDGPVLMLCHYCDERRIELSVMTKVSAVKKVTLVFDSRLCIQNNLKR